MGLRDTSVRWLKGLAACLLALALLGAGECSYRGHTWGGTTSGTTTQTAIGPISLFGSVAVGGVEYTTSAASVTINGVTAFEPQLEVGQLATVTGSVDASGTTGTATTVDVEDKLIGPVASVNLPAGALTVLGQTVQLDGDTSVDPAIVPGDAFGLGLGDVVVVDGIRTSTGFRATRLDRAAGQNFRVVGRVGGMAAFSQTFTLGGTTIDFGQLTGALPAGLANGDYVAASGTALNGATTLVASVVERETEATPGASGDSGSIYGAVTRFASASDFDVGGQAVTVTAATQYPGGGSATIAADATLRVSGQYDSAGRLVATSVDVRPAPNFRVVGAVEALDAVAGTLTIAGITLTTTTQTRWDDRSAVALRTLAFAAIASGDWLEVRGVATGTALAATADVVERSAAPTPALIELQDIAAVVADPRFTLMGVSVDARNAAFADASGLSLTRAAFFAAASGRLVRARGTLTGGTLTADLVSLRN